MIDYLSLIAIGGINAYSVKLHDIDVDLDLLSSFHNANSCLVSEIGDSLNNMGLEKNPFYFKKYNHKDCVLEMVIRSEKHNIEEGIKIKMDYLYNKYFKNQNILSENTCLRIHKLDNNVFQKSNYNLFDYEKLSYQDKKTLFNIVIREELEDKKLYNFVYQNVNFIKDFLDNSIENNFNDVVNSDIKDGIHDLGKNQIKKPEDISYALMSITNNFIYCNRKPKEKIIEYLTNWNLHHVPMIDDPKKAKFNLEKEGVRPKIHGIGFNTEFHLDEEPHNNLLLYFFAPTKNIKRYVKNISKELLQELTYLKEF